LDEKPELLHSGGFYASSVTRKNGNTTNKQQNPAAQYKHKQAHTKQQIMRTWNEIWGISCKEARWKKHFDPEYCIIPTQC